MKKLLTLLFACMMLISLTACKQKEEIIDNPVVNPMVEYNSLEEINEKIGVNIVSPGVMGKTDEKYFVVADQLAEYDFSLNGYEYTIRGAKITDQDISGIYDDNNIFEANQDSTCYLNDYYIERFFDEDKQYTIVLKDPNGMDEETFANIVLELKGLMVERKDNDYLLGDYADSVSKRATANVDFDGEYFIVNVSWSSSASETKTWTMNCTLDGDKLTYLGENTAVYTYDEDGNEMVADGAVNVAGYFEIIDEKLYWTGASDEACRACIFEKM